MEQLDFKLLSVPVTEKAKEFIQLAKDGKGFLVESAIDKDLLWETYLNAYPEEVNGIFRERRHYDGNYDKSFVRNVGRLVYMDKETGTLSSIWQVETEGYYKDVVETVTRKIQEYNVNSLWLPTERAYGSKSNYDNHQLDILWDHFHIENLKVHRDIGTLQGNFQSSMEVMERGLKEFNPETVQTVLDLCEANSIYRGNEHVETLRMLLQDLEKGTMETGDNVMVSNLYVLKETLKRGHGVRIRNTVIGSLLIDLHSGGKDLEIAVKAFESRVAPQNYKRTSSLITPAMVEQATKKLEELGLRGALTRRPVFMNDIPTNSVLFLNTVNELPSLDVLDQVTKDASNSRKFDASKAKPMDYSQLVEVLPQLDSIDILFEPKKQANLVTLSVDEDKNSKLLNWDNAFAWTYKGGVADAIKERVKEAGGEIDAKFRFSLAWHNADDLDFHLHTPQGKLYFGNKSSCGFRLDVDMNAGIGYNDVDPVENIFANSPRDGVYSLVVHNWNKRSVAPENQGFTIQCSIDDQVVEYRYDKSVMYNEKVKVLEFTIENGVLKVTNVNKLLTHNICVGEVWGITTGQFHKVDLVTLTPNQWNNTDASLAHVLFFVNGCMPEEKFRPFFNEQLRSDLTPHRKVFEVIGGKAMIEPQEDQLAGFGFNINDKESEVTLRLTYKNSKQEIVSINFKG